MLKSLTLAGLGAALITSTGYAQATSPDLGDVDRPRWNLGVNVSLISTDLEIVSTQAELPDDFVLEDATLDLSDVRLQARSVALSASYFVLPFLEVAGLAGVVTSETEADLRLEGTLNSGFDPIDGPVSLQLNNDRETDGFIYGAGVHAYLPLLVTPSDTLVVRSGANWAQSQYNSEDLQTFSYNLSSSVVYLRNRGGGDYMLNLGVVYQFIDREVERSLELGGEPITVRLNQELIDPWAIQFGAGVKVSESMTLSYGSSYNLGGEFSHLFRLGWSH